MKKDFALSSMVIASSGTLSSAIDVDELQRHGCSGVCIQAPATLQGTLTVQISLDEGTTYADLQSPPGTDITIAQAKAIVIDFRAWDKIRVKSDTSETGGERTILVRGVRRY